MTIALYGVGFVGRDVAELVVERGRSLICVDIDHEVVDRINARSYLSVDDWHRVSATTDGTAAASRVSTCLVTVPTPLDSANTVDLSALRSAAETIASGLQKATSGEPTLVVIESTVPPGTVREAIAAIFERHGLERGTDFFLAAVPERVDPGTDEWPLEAIPRVAGALTSEGLTSAVELYDWLLDAHVHPVDTVEIAEASKVIENAFRDINIAFANEVALSLDSLGVDAQSTIDAAATKPFGFMAFEPGAGVGGHCIPIDPYFLINEAEDAGFRHELLTVARRINDRMPRYVADLTVRALTRAEMLPQDATALLLGRSFKPDLADDRNSPYFSIRDRLREYGVSTETYDPMLSDASSVDSPYQSVDAVVSVTDHSEFAELDPHRFANLGVATIVDGRNVFDPETVESVGLCYEGVGRDRHAADDAREARPTDRGISQ